MPTGQTQKKYGDTEKALEPLDIRDIVTMLDRTLPGVKIRNHKILSGLMFFEIDDNPRRLRSGQMAYVRNFLVAGEDPHEEGCIAAMYMSDGLYSQGQRPKLITVHMRSVWDTRGGFKNIAWCSALQLRGLTKYRNPSASCAAFERSRRWYCRALLTLLDDSRPFRDQDWRGIQNVINRHQYLLPGNNNQHRPEVINGEPDEDDDDQDDNPGPNYPHYRDDEDDEDFYGLNERARLRRSMIHNRRIENDEDEPMDDDQDFDLGDKTATVDELRFTYQHHGSPNRSFVPHSRETSPEIQVKAVTYTRTHQYDLDMDMDPLEDESDADIDQTITHRLPIQPKPKLKVEPGAEVTTVVGQTRPFIDLTGDFDMTDEFVDFNSGMVEVVDLTQDSDVVENGSTMEVVELDL